MSYLQCTDIFPLRHVCLTTWPATLKQTWKESFLSASSNKCSTLNLIQATPSFLSVHSSFSSWTTLSMEDPFHSVLSLPSGTTDGTAELDAPKANNKTITTPLAQWFCFFILFWLLRSVYRVLLTVRLNDREW